MSEHGHTIEVDGVHIGTHSVRAMLARIAELEAENAAYSIVNTRQAEQIVDLEAAQEWLQHFSDDVTAKMEYQARRAEQAEADYANAAAGRREFARELREAEAEVARRQAMFEQAHERANEAEAERDAMYQACKDAGWNVTGGEPEKFVAELAALKARIIQAHFYRLPVIALDVETDEGGVHWIDGMSAAEVLAIVHDDVPAPVYESVPRTVSDGWKQAEAEFNRMSITYVHECARLKIRAEQAEAENKALQAERDNVPNVIALMKRAKKAEAEREAIAKSLQACGNYTGYTMYVEQRDRVDEAETELATLKWKLDYLVAEFSDVGKVPVSGIREDLEEAWTAREGTP